MEIDRYQYYAFISYSHADEKWAKWLHKKLENYKLPSIIRKESGGRIPKHIRPVFRDQTDLGIGSLQQSLRKELEDARYLIVVCSPNSAGSEWVNKEIQVFKELGRSDRIVPFIIKGTPDAAEEGLQCYPPALRETGDSILGASLEELKPEEALIKIVASLLGLKYDQLYRRHKRREKKNRMLLASALAFLVIAAGLVTYLFWDYNRIKVNYFTDYTESWGVPEGLFELSSQQIKSMDVYYRFEYQQGKLRKVIHANSAGIPVPVEVKNFDYRPMIQALYYRGEGMLPDHVDYLDRNGKVLVRNTYSGKDQSVKDFSHADQYSTAMTLSGRITSASAGIFDLNANAENKSDIARYLLQRDKSGRVVSVRFARDNRNTPVKDADGIFGFIIHRDELGRETEIIYTNEQGNPWPSHLGILGERYAYDKSGNLTRIEYINKSMQPAYNNEQGYAYVEMSYDSTGNMSVRKFYDSSGNPCLDRKDQAASVKYQFDARGFTIRQTCYGKDGEKCLSKDGAEKTAEYDKWGNMVRMSCLDINGDPYTCSDGYSSYTATFDDHGNNLSVWYFDEKNRPCLCRQGYAECRRTYDSNWNVTEVGYYGTDGKPCLDSDNAIAGSKINYDEQGRAIRYVNIGIDGKPCLNNNWFAEVTYVYDSRGNITDIRYLDEAGKPCLSKNENAAGFTYEYDSYGNLTRSICYGTDGLMCTGKYWYSDIRWEFDDRGNLVSESYYGKDGKLCISNDGYAELRIQYDASGNRIEQSYWGTDGERVFTPDHGAVQKIKYNEYGNETEYSWWDITGQPVLNDSGYASSRIDYDDRGNIIGKSFFDVSGMLTYCSEGYARQTVIYNERNQDVEESYRGAKDEPVLIGDGYARTAFVRDEYGRVLRQESYGLNGEPCMTAKNYCTITWDYDERGNEIRRTYLGTDGKPCYSNTDYGAGVSYKYDEHNRIIETTMLGLDGKPRLYNFGYAILKTEYDAFGNQSYVRSFDESGKPCLSWYGYAVVECKYDSRGNIIETHYYGIDGKPCVSGDGIAGFVSQYDERSLETAKFYLSVNSRYTPGDMSFYGDGEYLGYLFKYDDSGHCIEKRYVNSSGELACSVEGLAIIRNTYDDRGNEIEEKYFGADEQPCINLERACAIIKTTRDKRGNTVRIDYYNTDGSLRDEYEATNLYTYDAYGKQTGEQYLDKNGNAIQTVHMIRIEEVFPGSPAESIGIMPYDILVELSGWSFFSGRSFDDVCSELLQTVSDTKESEKNIKIIRNDKLVSFHLPSGSMGIRFVDYLAPESRMNKAYNVYMGKKK